MIVLAIAATVASAGWTWLTLVDAPLGLGKIVAAWAATTVLWLAWAVG